MLIKVGKRVAACWLSIQCTTDQRVILVETPVAQKQPFLCEIITTVVSINAFHWLFTKSETINSFFIHHVLDNNRVVSNISAESETPHTITTTDLICWAFQITRGMHKIS